MQEERSDDFGFELDSRADGHNLRNPRNTLISLQVHFHVAFQMIVYIVKSLPACNVGSLGTKLELKTAVKAAEAILAGNFYKYVAEAAQNQLKASVKLLQSLLAEEPPESFGKATQFMLDCWARAPLFFTYVKEIEVEKSEGEEKEVTSTTLHGVAGLEALWECIQAKTDEELQMSDLTALHTYSPWLPAESRKAFRDRKSRLEKGVSSAATAKAKPKPASADTKKRKAASTSDADALTAARELLGRRRKA
eukprot:2271628-Amphidinium_carterae.4